MLNKINLKEIKKAVIQRFKEKTQLRPGHIFSCISEAEQTLTRNNVYIDYSNDIVFIGSIPVFKIKRRYSTRKINMCYKELTPTIEAL